MIGMDERFYSLQYSIIRGYVGDMWGHPVFGFVMDFLAELSNEENQ